MTPQTRLEAFRAALRAKAPLVHNLTSAVVANFTANALLAVGASPAMVESVDEVAAFAAMADALVVNLGSLTPARAGVMRIAVESAGKAATPWVLDPVGAGAIGPRTIFALELCGRRPTAIRGNASEIMGLSGLTGHGRGVDAGAVSEAAIDAARGLALRTGAIVAVTGPIDYITDGHTILSELHGHPMMTRVTGMGCAASAITAACLAVGEANLHAVAYALAINGIAGERAAQVAQGPGSLAAAYLDALA